ncbi:hypothetical protein Q8A67_013805 [Cirrhinus molitorella]|uniref:Uncharacterized protein n=1 Tax=Cirrhinus molitorella TaxID=172907 RepID=A0AA88TNS5_9TELE|nr:hypothetical protein Q8A67_013805 [Cirrhinus molitorella]
MLCGFLQGLDALQACRWYRHCSRLYRINFKTETFSTRKPARFIRTPTRKRNTMENGVRVYTFILLRNHTENKNPTERFYYEMLRWG